MRELKQEPKKEKKSKLSDIFDTVSDAYHSSAFSRLATRPIANAYQHSALYNWLNPFTESEAKIVIDAIESTIPNKERATNKLILDQIHEQIRKAKESKDKDRFSTCLEQIQRYAHSVYFSKKFNKYSAEEALFYSELLNHNNIKWRYLNKHQLNGTRPAGWQLASEISQKVGVGPLRLKGDTELIYETRPDFEKKEITNNIRKLRAKIEENSKGDLTGYNYYSALYSEQRGFGNCGEHASLVLKTFLDEGFQGNAEIVEVKGKIRSKETPDEEFDYDHVFVRANILPHSNPSDATTWGPDAFVVDTWSGEVYLANEIYQKLSGIEPFDPRAHSIVPINSASTLAALKSWCREHNIPLGKKETVQTADTHTSVDQQTLSSISDQATETSGPASTYSALMPLFPTSENILSTFATEHQDIDLAEEAPKEKKMLEKTSSSEVEITTPEVDKDKGNEMSSEKMYF